MSGIGQIRKELIKMEPIFHHRDITNSREDVDKIMHEDFWEISASGKLYTREFVLDHLEKRYREEDVDEMVRENWQVIDFEVRQIGEDVYMATYILDGQGRLTRRTTLWKGSLPEGFKILYHQGTIILAQ